MLASAFPDNHKEAVIKVSSAHEREVRSGIVEEVLISRYSHPLIGNDGKAIMAAADWGFVAWRRASLPRLGG
jgi:hypothetical protein